ncbi:MAG: sel1 repeat family protein [Pseudobacteriovorax sp.]|nr:sel1 repeat family protein [Pseudobacteriovorax sp.]
MSRLVFIILLAAMSSCREKAVVPSPIVVDNKSPKTADAEMKMAAKPLLKDVTTPIPAPVKSKSADIKSAEKKEPRKELSKKEILEKIKQEAVAEQALIEKRRQKQKVAIVPTTSEENSNNPLFNRAKRLAALDRVDEARELYLESCQNGYMPSCHKFGYYEQMRKNFQNAYRFYKLSCQAGIPKSCNNLGFGLEKSGNLEQAKDYYSMACVDKHQRACKNLARVIAKNQAKDRRRSR